MKRRNINTMTDKHLARATVGDRSNRPVKIVAGDAAPHYEGSSYYWTNRSGDVVRHPSAYSRVGWSSLVYHCSTLHIEVGADWLARVRKPDYALIIAAYR